MAVKQFSEYDSEYKQVKKFHSYRYRIMHFHFQSRVFQQGLFFYYSENQGDGGLCSLFSTEGL